MASLISERAARAARPWLGLLFGLVALGRVAAVHADPAAPAPSAAARQSAHARLVEGVNLLRKSAYGEALAKFDQAYALVPSPNIHFDRGLAYVGLGRDADALEAFDAFLAAAPDRAPPGTRDKAQRQRLTLLTQVATLQITSDVAGAQITLDGRGRGTTPLDGSLYLDAGLHEVSARVAATGAAALERVAAAPGQRLSVMLRLGGAGAGTAAGEAVAAPPITAMKTALETQSPAAPPASAHPAGATAPPERHAVGLWSVSAATVGVALLGAGATFEWLARREGNSLSEDSRNGTPPQPPVLFDRAKETNGLQYQTVGVICLVAGAAALATGVVLYAFTRRAEGRVADTERPRARTGLALTGTPAVTRTFAGAGLQLSF
jgi:hypothetical protein